MSSIPYFVIILLMFILLLHVHVWRTSNIVVDYEQSLFWEKEKMGSIAIIALEQ